MPNIIKSNYVFITGDKVKVIDSNLKDDDFSPMQMAEAISLQGDSSESDEDLKQLEAAFQMNHSMNASQSLHKMQSQAETIVQNAIQEAEEIKMDAVKSAGIEIERCKEEARQSGYEEGIKQGMLEIESKKEELESEKLKLEEKFDERIMDLQSNLSELLIDFIRKITGVVVEEKNIIAYLIREAIRGQSSCNDYLIQVSKVDYPLVLEQMDGYKEMIKRTANLAVEENPELEKNQCMIITDKNIIDCSLETKLENLAEALKLLSLN